MSGDILLLRRAAIWRNYITMWKYLPLVTKLLEKILCGALHCSLVFYFAQKYNCTVRVMSVWGNLDIEKESSNDSYS